MVPGCFSRPRMWIWRGGVKFVLSAEAVVVAAQMVNVWFFSSAPDGAVGISSSWAVVASMPHNEHRQAVGQSLSSPSWPLMGCSSASKGNREQKVHHLCPLHILHCWCWEKEHWTRWTIAELLGDSSYSSSILIVQVVPKLRFRCSEK